MILMQYKNNNNKKKITQMVIFFCAQNILLNLVILGYTKVLKLLG